MSHIDKHATALEASAIFDIVNANRMRIAGMFWGTGVDDVEFFLVGRETNAIGLIHVGGNNSDLACVGIEPVDIGGQFEVSFVAFVIGHDAVAGIGEPDGAVGMDGEVVRGVELLVLKLVHEHGNGAIVFGASKAPGVMFAGEKASLAVTKVAIAIVGRAAENADLAGILEPTQHAIVGDVAEEEVAAVA